MGQKFYNDFFFSQDWTSKTFLLTRARAMTMTMMSSTSGGGGGTTTTTNTNTNNAQQPRKRDELRELSQTLKKYAGQSGSDASSKMRLEEERRLVFQR
tara:strand:+ start:360 stop:653 length:294 start_codon:yes stop_codon:yes gene_type:complete